MMNQAEIEAAEAGQIGRAKGATNEGQSEYKFILLNKQQRLDTWSNLAFVSLGTLLLQDCYRHGMQQRIEKGEP